MHGNLGDTVLAAQTPGTAARSIGRRRTPSGGVKEMERTVVSAYRIDAKEGFR